MAIFTKLNLQNRKEFVKQLRCFVADHNLLKLEYSKNSASIIDYKYYREKLLKTLNEKYSNVYENEEIGLLVFTKEQSFTKEDVTFYFKVVKTTSGSVTIKMM